jgi:VWFA-related protein
MVPLLLAGGPLLGQQAAGKNQPASQQSVRPTSNQQTTTQQSAAPQTDRKPDISMRVKVVNVPATVRDKHGQLVKTLGKDDFVLEEDGRPQVIHYFARDTDLPLSLGLLVDTSLSQRRVLELERHASYTFLDQMLRQPKDAAFLIHFDHEVELLQDLTSSREKLQSALQSLQAAEFTRTSGGGPSGSGGGRRRGGGDFREGGTLLYDSVFLAADELMKKQEGRKALLVLSDGVDRHSKETLDNAIASAQKSDTVVYAILFADEEHEHYGGYGGGMGRHGGWGGPGRGRYPREARPDGKKILQRIAKETGGRFFEVSKKQPVEKIYEAIADELRNQYNLGYTPDRADLAEGYHKIHLTAKQKDLVVQARDGYYADR